MPTDGACMGKEPEAACEIQGEAGRCAVKHKPCNHMIVCVPNPGALELIRTAPARLSQYAKESPADALAYGSVSLAGLLAIGFVAFSGRNKRDPGER